MEISLCCVKDTLNADASVQRCPDNCTKWNFVLGLGRVLIKASNLGSGPSPGVLTQGLKPCLLTQKSAIVNRMVDR